MATRIFLRKNGSSEPGCMAKLPATWAELLAVADTKLLPALDPAASGSAQDVRDWTPPVPRPSRRVWCKYGELMKQRYGEARRGAAGADPDAPDTSLCSLSK